MQWRRLLFENEISMGADFLEEIQAIHINLQQLDKWVWTNDTTGKYTVRSAYQLLDRNSKDDNTDEIFHAIWKLKIPNKVAFFVWRLMRDRLPIKLNLTRRNINSNDALCPFGTKKEEDAGHLFFSCHRIRQIWWES